MDSQCYWAWQARAICWHLWEPGTRGSGNRSAQSPVSSQVKPKARKKQNILVYVAFKKCKMYPLSFDQIWYEPLIRPRLDRKLETRSHLSWLCSPHTVTISWWHGGHPPIRGERRGPRANQRTRFCLFHGLDTLTREQANDILIGHQNSPDKGLGEVIICYKIISTLRSLFELRVETTTERE